MLSQNNLYTLYTLKISNTKIDTPAFYAIKVTSKSNKPNIYNRERYKLKDQLLQVNCYFYLKGDKVNDNNTVVQATTFLRGNAREQARLIIC